MLRLTALKPTHMVTKSHAFLQGTTGDCILASGRASLRIGNRFGGQVQAFLSPGTIQAPDSNSLVTMDGASVAQGGQMVSGEAGDSSEQRGKRVSHVPTA